MAINKHHPTRTCIATRTACPAEQLLRVVESSTQPGVIIPDPKRTLPGRGAWVTPTRDAVETARKRNAFARALRMQGPVRVEAVVEYVTRMSRLDNSGPEDGGKKVHHEWNRQDYEKDRLLMSK